MDGQTYEGMGRVLRAADAAAVYQRRKGSRAGIIWAAGYLCLRGCCWKNGFSAVDLPIGTGRERGSHGIVETEGGAVSSAGVCAAVAVSLLDGSAVLDFTKLLAIRFTGLRVTGPVIVETEGGAVSSAGVRAPAVVAAVAASPVVASTASP